MVVSFQCYQIKVETENENVEKQDITSFAVGKYYITNECLKFHAAQFPKQDTKFMMFPNHQIKTRSTQYKRSPSNVFQREAFQKIWAKFQSKYTFWSNNFVKMRLKSSCRTKVTSFRRCISQENSQKFK